jgi:hypothetical protein
MKSAEGTCKGKGRKIGFLSDSVLHRLSFPFDKLLKIYEDQTKSQDLLKVFKSKCAFFLGL